MKRLGCEKSVLAVKVGLSVGFALGFARSEGGSRKILRFEVPSIRKLILLPQLLRVVLGMDQCLTCEAIAIGATVEIAIAVRINVVSVRHGFTLETFCDVKLSRLFSQISVPVSVFLILLESSRFQ